MEKPGYLPKEKLNTLLEALSKKFQVFVPCKEGEVVLFQLFDPAKTLSFERPANIPPKAVIFPQSESMFKFEYRKDPEDPKKVSIKLKEEIEFLPSIIFGARPCDGEGFKIFDRVYIESDAPDPYYQVRREKTTMVVLTCNSPSPGCFCTSVGRVPAAKDGADLLMTELET